MKQPSEKSDHLFSHPCWIEWVRRREGLDLVRIEAGKGPAAGRSYGCIHAFARSSGRLRTPNLQPYLAAQLETTDASSPTKVANQRLDLCIELAQQMVASGFAGSINLPDSFSDLRPWQWSNLRVEPFYTYHLDPARYTELMLPSVKKSIKKATRLDYNYCTNPSSEDVINCLDATENAKGFTYGLTAKELDQLRSDFSPAEVRCYLATDKNGEPVSSRVILRTSPTTALDWVAGTAANHYQNGVTQKLISFALDDLSKDCITDFDFGGANIPNVARSKSYWGGDLKMMFAISPISFRSFAIDLIGTLRRLRR